MPVLQYSVPAQQLFNSDWQFHKDDIVNGENNSNDTIQWRTVNLPHNWSIESTLRQQ